MTDALVVTGAAVHAAADVIKTAFANGFYDYDGIGRAVLDAAAPHLRAADRDGPAAGCNLHRARAWRGCGACFDVLAGRVTELERLAASVAVLLPAENMALTVARGQIERGENPPVNTTAMLAATLDRLTGRADWTAQDGGPADE
jgi:hypothetical protein